MKIKKIEKYETTDGVVHDDFSEAESHQNFLDGMEKRLTPSLNLIEEYRKTHRQKFIPVKYYEDIMSLAKIDFVFFDGDKMEEVLFFAGFTLREQCVSIEILTDGREVSELLKERILTIGGYETTVRLDEYRDFCDILLRYSSEMTKEDIINIFSSIELVS